MAHEGSQGRPCREAHGRAGGEARKEPLRRELANGRSCLISLERPPGSHEDFPEPQASGKVLAPGGLLSVVDADLHDPVAPRPGEEAADAGAGDPEESGDFRLTVVLEIIETAGSHEECLPGIPGEVGSFRPGNPCAELTRTAGTRAFRPSGGTNVRHVNIISNWRGSRNGEFLGPLLPRRGR